MDNEVKQRNRRRKRAQRMQAQRANKVKEGDSAEDESPDREKPIRPPNRRKKSKEPLVEEDIIDGFAILGFRTYEDLENVIALAAGGGKPVTKTRTKEVSGGRTTVPTPLDDKPKLPSHHHHHHHHNTHHHITSNLHPPSHGLLLTHAADAGTSDDSGRASERLTGSSVAPRDPDSSRDRLSDASSRCSSGKGYICDSEGEDDKGSDAGSVLFASTPSSGQRKHEFPPSSGIPSGVPGGGGASPLPDAPRSPCMAPPAPSPAPAALPPQPPVLATHMVPAEVPPPTSAVKSCGPPSIASLLNTHSAQMQASHHHHSLTTQIPQANHPPPINQTQPTSVPNHISTNLSATNHISTSLSSSNHMSAGLTANNHISVSNHISTSLSVTSHSHIATSLSSSHLSMPQNGHLVGPGHATTLSNIHNSGNPSTLSYPNAQPSNHHPPVSRAPSPPPPLSAATPPASLPAALPQSASAPHEASPISTTATTPGSYLNGIVSTSGSVPLPPTNGYAPTQPMAFPAYPPLYAPYATSLRNSSTVPMSSHRSPATTLTTLSTVTQPVTTATTTTPVSQVQPMPQSTASSHRDAITGVVANSRPTHSPRGHSPTRERDSYSSNVSSLSRGSVTPVSLPYSSGSVAASTALSSSYSKAASWSTATVGATRMSPAAPPPRPTPPPPSSLHSSYPPPQAAPAQAPPPMFAPPPPVSTASPLALQSNPNPFSADSLFQSNQTDMLRRELDSRFLASHAPSYLRTEMHQHQHHHTHVHQHAAPILPPPAAPPAVVPPPALFPPPLFKDIPKMGSIDSPFYRQNLGLPSYPSYSTGLLHPGLGGPTPFVPPNHLPAFQPKKSGRWNAMHVRVAWEIYHHQQKQQAELKPGSVKPDLLRPPSHMFPPGGLVHPARPHELPFHRAAQFETAPHPSSLFTAPPSHLAGISPFGRYSTFPNPGSPFGLSPFSTARDMPPMGSLHDPWRSVTALQRSVANYPPTAGPWGLKPDPVALERREQEERERERIRRERERERERKQQLEQQERERERDRREKERREHERRELDRLHQQRLAAETKVRERSPLRNGTSDDIRVKEEPRIKEEDVLGKATDPRYHPYMRHPSGLVPPAQSRNNSQLSGPPSLPTHFPPPPTPAWPPPSSADPFRDPYRFETLRYNPIMEAAMRAEEERAKMFGPYSNPHLRPTSKDMLHLRPTVPPSHLAPPPPTKEDSSTSR